MTAIPDAVRHLRELALSAARAASVRAAAKLGIADALGDEPSTVEELAAATGTDPGALGRLLRTLAWHGVFAEDEAGRYRHTEMSKLLAEDAPRSLKHIVLWGTEPWSWELWPHLDEAVRSGTSVFPLLHGKDFFEYLHAEAPESAEVFDRAMTQSSRLSATAIADRIELDGSETVADIAGGQGHVLATLLERHPDLSGALLELPGVLANADPRLRPGGPLAGRVRLVPGDCRDEVPVPADVYVLKNVLEWDDDSTVTTLRNVAGAARPGARVLVLENLLDDSPELGFTTAMDLLLLLNVGGRKHTEDGLLALVAAAGLRLVDVRPLNSYLHVIEAVVDHA
ncbi:methyltransferase [Amycolatopsis minnesotensis]|uniref:Methyltransferase n=1 Tax=Amycolatopsis minnesotensis TaxID=337894 RepID=A0ABN2QK98_9PSEU